MFYQGREVTKPVTSLVGPCRRPDSHQELALAVIIQAIRDLDLAPGKHREEAVAFLSGHAMAQWCGVAGLEPDFVKDVVRRHLESKSCQRGSDLALGTTRC